VEKALVSVASGVKAVAERVEATETFVAGKLVQLGRSNGIGCSDGNGYGEDVSSNNDAARCSQTLA
jgi:hypothetical protein